MMFSRSLLGPVVALACMAGVRALTINEVLPVNDGGLNDADGDSPGWVEIYNETAAPVSLAGWHLTDSAANPVKWTFPATNLPAGGYVVVFTSGKDRAVAGQELHANFQLDPDGEYLALVAPDGVTKATEFAPKLPSLRRNVSYAVTTAQLTTAALTDVTPLRWKVPVDAGLGTSWTGAAFSDAAWAAGTQALGFDAAVSQTRIDLKTVTSITGVPAPVGWTGVAFTGVGESGAGTLTTATAAAAGLTVKIDTVGSGITLNSRNRQGTASDSLADASSLNNVAEDFLFANNSTYTAGTPKGLQLTVSGLTAGTVYPVTLWAFDRASGTNRSAVWTDTVSAASATLTFNGSDGPLANDTAFNARSITVNAQTNASGQLILQGVAGPAGSTTSHNVFINAFQIGALSYTPLIGTNVGAPMQGQNATLYARSTFTVTTPAAYSQARLRIRYDDGFFAWIDGVLIASRNAPASATWNAAATADRAKSAAIVPEEIVFPLPAGLLVEGANVLAIQGLNQSAANTDFLLGASLDLVGSLAPAPRYYAAPTPGAANATAFDGVVKDTKFSVDRGFHTTAQTVALSCNTAGAQIRYTTDGSAPTASTGTVYTAPIDVTTTTVLRAAAFVPNWIPSNVDTQTYLFAGAIAAQPKAPAGWPADWGKDSEVASAAGTDGTVPADYEMDPNVTNVTIPGKGAVDALLALPTMSIAMAPADFLGTSGIYQNPRSTDAAGATTLQWERACSVELIDPTGAEKGFAETCGIAVHGNSSRRPWRVQKHGFGLTFRSELGAAKLNYRLFPDSPVNSFNKIVLRSAFTDGWCLVSWDAARYRPDDSLNFRDAWVKQAHRDMGYLATRNRFVHLFVNGLYWGIYNPCEHIDEKMAASQLGGKETDWEVVADFVDPDASATSRWKSLFTLVNAGVTTDAAYQQVLQYIDPASFIDYYLLHVFIDAEDWPHHNGYAVRNKTLPNDRYRWLAWDQEIMFDNHGIDRLSTGAGNTGTDRTPGRLYQQLKANAEFRLLFADRAHRHLHNGGALSLANSQNRWQAIADGLDTAIVAESARWGDTADETPYGNAVSKPVFTREADWLPNVALVRDTYLPSLFNDANSYSTVRKLKAAGLYPNTEPPVFSTFGGTVAGGFGLTMSATVGTIYYTLDGSDPRQAVTGAAVGLPYGGAVALTQTGTVKARALNGTEWSALTEAFFVVGVPASAANLVITELNFAPTNPLEEFVEIMNTSATPIDLTGVAFVNGIGFSFADGFVLQPGQRAVVVRDEAAFAARYGSGALVAGHYTGALDNSGETLALVANGGAEIANFRYESSAPWPGVVGAGVSLTLIAPGTHPDPADPTSWRTSDITGGTPGATDAVAFTGSTPNADQNGNGLTDFTDYALTERPGLHYSVAEGTWVFTITRVNAADDAKVTIETTSDLQQWSTLTATALLSQEPVASGVVRQTWAVVPAPGAERLAARARVEMR